MSVTKELIEQEAQLLAGGERMVVHLHKEGTFLRAYEWSAFLSCHFIHQFKVNKRMFKGIDQPVAYIGFPETSLAKWMPEGAEQEAIGEKHLAIRLPSLMLAGDAPETLDPVYGEWKEGIPLTESKEKGDRRADGNDVFGGGGDGRVTLTSVMQRILAYPIESKSPMESMSFLADVKRQLANLI
ncbi:MAG: hypothetical protein IJK42_09495 [Prevotella sp.]|nr:hypothetical protein [Prevotella sp.]